MEITKTYSAGDSPENRYEALAEALLGTPNVTLGSPGRRGFGADALQTDGKIFAMLSRGCLVVKLPRSRVDALVGAGEGERFEPGHGRVLKEWFVLDETSQQDWLSLAREALGFVSGLR